MKRLTVSALNQSVLKDLYLNGDYNLGKQLYEAYPESMQCNGHNIKLKTLNSFHNNLSEFSWWYGRSIEFNLELHNRIMEALEYAKENDMIHMDLRSFLHVGWLSIEYYRTHPEESASIDQISNS
jgi:hypothetical protein